MRRSWLWARPAGGDTEWAWTGGIAVSALLLAAAPVLGWPAWSLLPALVGLLTTAEARRRAKQALQRERALFDALVTNAMDAVAVVSADATVSYVSPAIERVLGHPPEHYRGGSIFDHVHPDDAEGAGAALAQALAAPGHVVRTELRVAHDDGGHRWIECWGVNRLDDPAVAGLVVNLRDVTEQKRSKLQLERLALHDPLTGLPNRALLLERIDAAIAGRGGEGRHVALLFCDLDRFKVVNDSLGHEVGDLLLVAVAQRLRGAVGRSDTVARLGGDEFVVLCEGLREPADASAIAARIAAALAAPFDISGHELFVTVSIGIAGVSDEVDSARAVLRDADAAMYRAKERGRDRYDVFDESMRSLVVARLELEGALRRALERDELHPVYQPVVSLRSGEVRELEALVRWEHPQRGCVPPSDFIAVAEDSGLVVALGEQVLRTACDELAAWHSVGGDDLVVAVNVSARQLRGPAFLDVVTEVLASSGVAAHQLRLELTESALMDDVETSRAVLAGLRDLGVRIALDDFGTGYSALSHLKRFPVDVVKIDRTFVAELPGRQQDAEIVRAIVGMAHALGIDVVAEGVETQAQLEVLTALGCDAVQGFLLARPGPFAGATARRQLAPAAPLEA